LNFVNVLNEILFSGRRTFFSKSQQTMKNTQSIADFPIRERIYYDVSSRIITVPMQKRLKVSMTANISDFTWPTATSHVTFTS